MYDKLRIAGCAAGMVAAQAAFGSLIIAQEGGGAPAGMEMPSVAPNAEASLSLRMFGTQGTAFINSWGDVAVVRGTDEFTNIGPNVNGAGDVLAQWDEFVGDSFNTIQVTWKSSNGEDLLPAGAQVGGADAMFLGWLLGASMPVDFGEWIDPASIHVFSATVSISSDGGGSFDVFNVTNTLSDPWDGTDTSSALPMVGEGVNLILAQYQFTFVPAPGAAGVLLMGIGLGLRRRR